MRWGGLRHSTLCIKSSGTETALRICRDIHNYSLVRISLPANMDFLTHHYSLSRKHPHSSVSALHWRTPQFSRAQYSCSRPLIEVLLLRSCISHCLWREEETQHTFIHHTRVQLYSDRCSDDLAQESRRVFALWCGSVLHFGWLTGVWFLEFVCGQRLGEGLVLNINSLEYHKIWTSSIYLSGAHKSNDQ